MPWRHAFREALDGLAAAVRVDALALTTIRRMARITQRERLGHASFIVRSVAAVCAAWFSLTTFYALNGRCKSSFG